MNLRGIIALAIVLSCAPAFAQTNQGSSPLTGPKGGTNNAWMQFTGPAASLKTYTLPNASDTIATLAAVQAITGAKTFASAKLLLSGSTSGAGTLNAPAAASSYVWTMPAATGTIAYLGNKLSDFASTTSAELAGNVSDETGSGALVFGTSPTLTTPVLGVAAATSINKVAITSPATAATLTIPNGVTLTGPAASGTVMTLGNAETVTGVKSFNDATVILNGSTSGTTTLKASATAGSTTVTLPAATDTLVGKATTDTLTNKSFDTAGAGNSLSINGVAATANTGTGAVARAVSPSFTTPALGTPASGVATNITGLPILTGLTGAGTGVLSALGINVGSAGAVVVNGGVLGTPSSGTLTNATGLPTAGLVNNAVTNAKLAQVATATFKGRTTAGTGDPEDLTATQATALLNVMVGDSGAGGTKGLVPAAGSGDAAAGKYLKADGTFAVPPGTGGGGSLPDNVRQNVLLDTIYLSKALGDYRRAVNVFADGFKSTGGINAGSSSNYNAVTASGYVAPTTSAGTFSTAEDPTLNQNSTGWGGYAIRQKILAAAHANISGGKMRVTLTPPTTGNNTSISNVYIGHKGTGAFDFDGGQVRVTFSAGNSTTLTAGGSSVLSDAVTYTFDKTKDLIIAFDIGGTSDIRNNNTAGVTNYTYAYKAAATEASLTTATGYTTTATVVGIVDLVEVETTPGSTNNMTLVTAAQTADSSVSNGRVLIEFDNTATPTLNTDLTAEVTCNGGTNWASASLSAVTAYSQGGRKVAESVDQACTSGTSFAARLKTLNNKNVPIYGASLTVH